MMKFTRTDGGNIAAWRAGGNIGTTPERIQEGVNTILGLYGNGDITQTAAERMLYHLQKRTPPGRMNETVTHALSQIGQPEYAAV